MSGLEKGISAFESGDYVAAFLILLPLAEAGKAQAQSLIASMYMLGLGREIDLSEAIQWYLKAAKQGHPVAQHNLGSLYLEQKKTVEALEWYLKAAEQGFPFAQEELGDIYAFGLGMDKYEAEAFKDEVQAAKWYLKAAEQGLPFACYRLGEIYANGTGVEKNEAEAVKWYHAAAQQNYEPSQEILGKAYQEGLLGLPRASELAQYWLQKAKNNKTLNEQLS